MNTSQNTRDTFAAMIAKQQEKSQKAKNNILKETAPKQETPRTFDNIEEITEAAKSGEVISLHNLAQIVNEEPTQAQDEVDKIDITDLFKTETPAPIIKFEPREDQAKTPLSLKIVSYTERSFLVIGDTKEIKEELNAIGGIFRPYWKGHGPAWMFAERRRDEVEQFINDL